MSISAPILAGQTLPSPRSYKRVNLWRSGAVTTASGVVSHDLMNDALKHRFDLAWQMTPETEIGYIETAYAAMGAGPVTFVDTMGDSFTVVRPAGDGGIEIEWTAVRGSYYGSVSLVLIEV